MKRLFALQVVALGSLALVACSGDDSTAFPADGGGDGAPEASTHADAAPGTDSGSPVSDATVNDTGAQGDAGVDAEPDDTGADAGADSTTDAPVDAPADAVTGDSATTDAASDAASDAAADAAITDAGADAQADATVSDAGADAAITDAGADALGDASDAGPDAQPFDGGVCPLIWFAQPAGVPSGLLVPDGGGSVLLHAHVEGGSQDYVCAVVNTSGGATLGWTRVGPDATLLDCLGNTVGTHFPSTIHPVDGGPAAPEWRTTDGHGVIASQLAAYTPDGGQSSVPWLLLQSIAHDGPDASAGVLDRVGFVQRVNTISGLPPASNCTHLGDTFSSPYSADYYFYGN